LPSCYAAEGVPLLDIIVGYDCNVYCDYCTITDAMRRRALTAGAIAAALAQGRADGYERVSFTGGEPTIRADLLPLLRRARALGFRDIKVQSNGLLLADPGNVDRLVAAGTTRVHISIHTHERDAYEALVRREGTYDAMVAALDGLAARDDVELVAEVILKADTYRRLPAALQWLQARGVAMADLWFVSLTDNNASNVASMPRMTEVVPVMREAFAWARAHGMRVRSLHVPRCLLHDDHPHAFDPAAEGVRVVTPDATFELGLSKLTGQLHVPACEGCEFRSRCPGLRQDYLDRYGDAEVANARGCEPSLLPRSLRIV
jgi:cyclic pyranopterin phosphate synthase